MVGKKSNARCGKGDEKKAKKMGPQAGPDVGGGEVGRAANASCCSSLRNTKQKTNEAKNQACRRPFLRVGELLKLPLLVVCERKEDNEVEWKEALTNFKTEERKQIKRNTHRAGKPGACGASEKCNGGGTRGCRRPKRRCIRWWSPSFQPPRSFGRLDSQCTNP